MTTSAIHREPKATEAALCGTLAPTGLDKHPEAAFLTHLEADAPGPLENARIATKPSFVEVERSIHSA